MKGMAGEWSEQALRSFIGKEEALRLEFKPGRLLDGKDEQVADDLSKAVSPLTWTGCVAPTGPAIASNKFWSPISIRR